MMLLLLLVTFGSASALETGPFHENCAPGHSGIVHLFEWKWNDIARECSTFLGPHRFCGVQVSPPNEHAIIDRPDYNVNIRFPWYQRYQPVSYKLESRSGSEADFIEMVKICNSANVRIYVDAVINHMAADPSTKIGSASSIFDPIALRYPDFGPSDFNSCDKCGTASCNIENYNDKNQVRNCRLVGLPDLDLGRQYVKQTVLRFLNRLIEIGVAGFRVDACKHMWPEDLEVIYAGLQDLRADVFGRGMRPFIVQEVIDLGGEPIGRSEYTHLGRVTEFAYSIKIGQAFNGGNQHEPEISHSQLKNLKSFGPAWGFMKSWQAFVFVDNHDNQRGHGPGGRDVITFYKGAAYRRAVAFMMAWPFGSPRIMSSFEWEGGPYQNDWIGPPTDGEGGTQSVEYVDGDHGTKQCINGWVCEHRWEAIRGMPRFRAVVGDAPVENWVAPSENQIAFSRGDRGFIAINNERNGQMSGTFQTGMAPGTYCNVAHASLMDSCQTVVKVEADGEIQLDLDGGESIGLVIIHTESAMSSISPTKPAITTRFTGRSTTRHTVASSTTHGEWVRTIIFVEKETRPGETLWMRGGPIYNENEKIEIRYPKYTERHFKAYMAWSVNDTELTWHGANPHQGDYRGHPAFGRPMAWTTNVENHAGFVKQNKFGHHYWMWDVEIRYKYSWFQFKTIIARLFGDQWEKDIQHEKCVGGEEPPERSNNHWARAGRVNVFHFDRAECMQTDID